MLVKTLRFTILLFISLWSLLVPLSYRIFNFHDAWLLEVLSQPLNSITNSIWGVTSKSILSSDSVSLYLWTLILAVISIIIGVFFILKLPKKARTFSVWMQKIALYFLTFQLMRYGFDKVFKAQFYLPEPNILATELGNLNKDILFWSAMGTSYAYNLFMGFIEILAASLLLFRKTRVLGLLISFGTIIQILAINFSFDISVKLFSSILLLTTTLLLLPYFKTLYSFLLQGKQIALPKPPKLNLKKWNASLKTIIISVLLIESIVPYIFASNFNDDHAQRPFLHGMYLNTAKDAKLKRIFIHRDGYLIFENNKGIKTDYALRVDEINQCLKVTNYKMETVAVPYRFDKKSEKLFLRLNNQKKAFMYKEWRDMPLLQDQWHWTVDGGF